MSEGVSDWIDVAGVEDVEVEDVIKVEQGDRIFAIYRSPSGDFFATDGICTHEHAFLSDGLVMDHVIECPKHNGRFDYRTGKALSRPACVDLKTYPVRVSDGRVLVKI